jgi:hypothetical protein
VLDQEYLMGLYRALISKHKWDRSQFYKFFPQHPQQIYLLMEKAGFSPSEYRNSWPDLIAGLPSEKWSAKHFVQFMDTEVRMPRRFPIHLDFSWLDTIAKEKIYNRNATASLLRNLIQAQVDFSYDVLKKAEFWENVFKTLFEIGAPMIFFGDSHSRLFRQTIQDWNHIIIPINILCGGGSAIGLANKNSRSGYGALLHLIVEAINEAKLRNNFKVPLCFNFGQVDVEFVHTYRRLKRKEFQQPSNAEFTEFCAQVVNSYVTWISNISPLDAVVVGINPPCINDEYIFEAYLAQMQVYLHAGVADENEGQSFEALVEDFKKLQLPNKRIRTHNHKLFNEHLQKEAEKHSISYIDGFQELMGPDGSISPKYAAAADGLDVVVGRDGKDIHIGGKYALKMQAQLTRRIFKQFF